MKRIVFVFATIVLLSYSLLLSADYKGPHPETNQGAAAMVFTYTPFQSNIGSAGAGYAYATDQIIAPIPGIGLKAFISDRLSLGFAVGLGLVSSTPDKSTDMSTSETLLGLSIDCNSHFKPLYGISPYFGGNINFGYYDKGTKVESGGNKTETSTSGLIIGIGPQLGFDWYFTDGIALGAKYTLTFLYCPEPSKETKTNSNTTTVDGDSRIKLSTGNATFTLTVHM
ncbi:MAG: b-brl 2 protein [Ignavibacteria bacterium]|nr:b-brl 2 protein [Ignavibacteria bacterium]